MNRVGVKEARYAAERLLAAAKPCDLDEWDQMGIDELDAQH